MALNLKIAQQKYNLQIKGIIHIGAHFGGEISIYEELNVPKVVFFEPLSSNFEILEQNTSQSTCDVELYNFALGNARKKVLMNISSNDKQSSSILEPKNHLIAHPEVLFEGQEEVEMKKLDDFKINQCNTLVVDVQGYELEVLKGAKKTLKNIDYIYAEVNRGEVYKDNVEVEELDEYLSDFGFKRIETEWSNSLVWGDALYVKTIKIKDDARYALFDWGDLDPSYAYMYGTENFVNRVYEKFYSIKKNDIVVDIGANCGSFSYSILKNKPKHIYCIEPDDRWVKCLNNNLKNAPVTIAHKFISDENTDTSITFKKFIEDNNIEHVDFLKFDCEGGETSIFTEENYEFISKNVKCAAGEWHFAPYQFAGYNFMMFKDLYLKPGKFKVYTRLFDDCTERVMNNQFITDFENNSWALHYSGNYIGQLFVYMWS